MIYFGNVCDDQAKEVVEKINGYVSYEALNKKCLGLPTVVGVQKMGALNMLEKDRDGRVKGCLRRMRGSHQVSSPSNPHVCHELFPVLQKTMLEPNDYLF